MPLIAYAVIRIVHLALNVLLFLMFARALASWFPDVADSAFGEFLYTVTEWVIYPVRALFEHFNILPMFPFDIPFFVTFLLLSVISSIL